MGASNERHAERLFDETGRAGPVRIRRLEPDDEEYPEQLRGIPEAPDFLYARGRLIRDDALAVAVVGSRHATPYGLGVAEELAADLASRGVTVVSGLARGIDSAAHRGALRAGGRTIAVLGCGADVIYPPENRRLAGEIEERGAVLSQFDLGTPPLAHHFPTRNRVIAGVALGVVVVEAAERSGALITARLAAECGREVMAVPGRVTSRSSVGANRLIQDGAALVMGWQDVVAALPARWRDCIRQAAPRDVGAAGDGEPSSPRRKIGEALGDEQDEGRLLGVVGDEPLTIDEVIELSGIAPGRAAALLLGLELRGRVRQIEGKRFVQTGA